MKTGLNIKVNMHMSWAFKEKNKEQLGHNQFRNGTKNLELRLVLSSVSLRYHPGLCSPCYQLPRHGHDLRSLSSHLRLFFSFSFRRQNLKKKKKSFIFYWGLWRSPGEWNGNPLQYSCLGNPKDRRAWQLVCEVSKELDKTEQLNNNIAN